MLSTRRKERSIQSSRVSEIIDELDLFLKKPSRTFYIDTYTDNSVTLRSPTLEINAGNLSDEDWKKILDFIVSKPGKIIPLSDFYRRVREKAFIFDMGDFKGLDRKEVMSILKMLGVNVEEGEDELAKRIPNSDNLSMGWTKYVFVDLDEKTIKAFEIIRIASPIRTTT